VPPDRLLVGRHLRPLPCPLYRRRLAGVFEFSLVPRASGWRF
jgi:hypothetical protein